MQKNAAFAEFIQAQEARPELVGLKVNALLITPVQRVPRYLAMISLSVRTYWFAFRFLFEFVFSHVRC